MKNTVRLLLLCCIFPSTVWAQTEFSQTGMQWETEYSSYGSWNHGDVFIDYLYELGGDTLVGDKNCKKLYQDEGLIGAFLEEGRKVWYYPFRMGEDNPERVLLYDFSLEKGDKIESYRIPYNTGGNLSGFDFDRGGATLTVENVYYKYGRKVMEVDLEYRTDLWIEGIGSPSGFWGAYLMIPTDGSNTSTGLIRALAPDKTMPYFNGQIVDPNYQTTFLQEGKTWEVLNHETNKIDKITIGKPKMMDYYQRYPVSSSVQPGYLYDVNGMIYYMFDRGDGLGSSRLECDHLLYDFSLSTGNRISLCTSPYFWGYGGYMPPTYRQYDVTQVDFVQIGGKSLKRIVLEGDIKHVWLENVGSLNSFLYIIWGKSHLDIPKSELLRCYLGDEVFYDSSGLPDGLEDEQLTSPPTYSVINGQLAVTDGAGYHLSLYDVSGIKVYNRTLTETPETIPLPGHPTSLLIGRLQKGESFISFKIGETD